MNRRTVLFLLVLLLVTQLTAQGWIKIYGWRGGMNYVDEGHWVEQTSDSGYIIVGQSGDGGYSLWLLKTDSLGDTVWTRIYRVEDRGTWGNCVQETDDKGYILTGKVWLLTDDQLLLLKTDSLGDTLWTRFYGGEHDERGYFVRQTSDGGYIITGYVGFDLYEELPRNLWLLKTDSAGDTLWTRTYGGAADDVGYCVQQTSDGGFIVTGYTKSFVGIGIGDLWLLKTDSAGDTLWTRTFGGEAYLWDLGRQVQEIDDGGYLIVGVTNFSAAIIPTAGDIWILRTDSAGDTLWTRTYGYEGTIVERTYSGEQTTDGGCIMVGEILSLGTGERDLWLLKTDSLGDTLWTRTFGGAEADVGTCVHQTPDGGYIITGYTDSYSEEEHDLDLWLIKTDSLGYVVSIAESSPIKVPPQWDVASPVGSHIVLRFRDYPQGIHLHVYDTSGRKVDELTSPAQKGVLIWGENHIPGVYFIVLKSAEATRAQKVVLIK